MDTRLRHESETVDVAFNSYFSRFIDIDEPAFIPLDPKDSFTPQDGERSHKPNGVPQQPSNGNSGESRDQDQNVTSDARPEWLQAYAGHLSGDIEDGEDTEANNKTSCHTELAQTEIMAQAIPDPPINTPQIQETVRTDPGGTQSPVTMVGPIPSSSSGRVPDPTIQAQDTQSEHHSYHGDVVRESNVMHVGDAFSELFSPMASFSDIAGLDSEMPMLPALGPANSGPDIWSDLFNQDMIG